jgi:elongation factor G
MKAYMYKNDESGKYDAVEIPEEVLSEAESYREKFVEAIAESDDILLEKYLEGGELTNEELIEGLKKSVSEGLFVPVLCGSAQMNIGIQPVMDAINNCLPSPLSRGVVEGKNPKTGDSIEIPSSPDDPFSAFIFKTVSDPFAGKLSVFRIYSGSLKADTAVVNTSKESKERIGQVLLMEGKKQKPVASASTGDIVTVAKLKETTTGDTLCDASRPVIFPTFPPSQAPLAFAIEPKTKADEDKVHSGLAKLLEEDQTLHFERDKQTKEFLLSGTGQEHLEVVVEKLKRKYGVEVALKTPKVPYKETIRSLVKVQGKYKKQSGGRGQYGDTWLEIEPLPEGKGFEFVDKIVGGAIPRQYIPAVEKGVKEAMAGGVLAGNPVVDVKVTLYDGSFHNVDSSEMAFKIAASMGFKKGVVDASPVLLEPIMLMEINVSDDNIGDVIGDMNSKRGKIQGVEAKGNAQIVKALVPMAEVLNYATELKSMTGGRGMFGMEFSCYEEVPAHLSQKIIAASKETKES